MTTQSPQSRPAPRSGDAVIPAGATDVTPSPSSVTPPVPVAAPVRGPAETLGAYLRHHRRALSMSLAEVSRITRIPGASLEAIEGDRFDELPGEVFVRGFLRAYAQAIGLLPDDVLARYTSSRRIAYVTPLPMQTRRAGGARGAGTALRRGDRVRPPPHPALARALHRAQATRPRHAGRAIAAASRRLAPALRLAG